MQGVTGSIPVVSTRKTRLRKQSGFSMKSVLTDGINPLAGMKSLRDEILLRRMKRTDFISSEAGSFRFHPAFARISPPGRAISSKNSNTSGQGPDAESTDSPLGSRPKRHQPTDIAVTNRILPPGLIVKPGFFCVGKTIHF